MSREAESSKLKGFQRRVDGGPKTGGICICLLMKNADLSNVMSPMNEKMRLLRMLAVTKIDCFVGRGGVFTAPL